MIIRLIVIALCSLVSLKVEAKVLEKKHVEEILPLIDEDTWFLVDLDNCMFQGAQALGHANWFYDQLQQRMEKGMTRDEAIADAYPDWIKTQKVCKVKPLEESFVPVLLSLQSKKTTIMGLTHRQPSVADSTARQVNSLGFDFSITAPSQDSFVVPAKTPTLYSQGILFVGDYNKKIDIFAAFLSIIKKSPKKIVFIDDKRKNVEELESLTKYGIEYIGIHYTAIEDSSPVYFPEVAEFQYKFLDQILSNEAALLLMKNGIK
ncbi:MAG: hypothetical protein BGO10_03230 [Chlamydia sp. 32-24]|nr:MAG: hypothetical protein BGO10_03230 [Chlamydia sp. 32-24]